MSFGIAVYGKGGIGKSTISANLSYALAASGLRVVQVGCDPKHDSTRLLHGGEVRTVLDMVRSVPPKKRNLSDVAVSGKMGVVCIEAGGPEPGVGCAGKGIITMFQTLDTLGIRDIDEDITVYDVLGDVVCGGFAIPMRPEHSDAVLIVTSGEFMSLYAANNIMKGISNYEKPGRPRLAGIIFNSRGSAYEESAVDRFSLSTGVPVVARIPRSSVFSEAEASCMTVSEYAPGSPEAYLFEELAQLVTCLVRGDGSTYSPRPLSDRQLDVLASGGIIGPGDFVRPVVMARPSPVIFEKCESFKAPRRVGVGPVGAALTAGKLTDVPVVIHGSRSCGYGMLNELNEARLAYLMSGNGSFTGDGGNLICSSVDNGETIFGGAKELETILEHLAHEHEWIIVIMTCLTSMIGDDVDGAVSRVKSAHPGVEISVIAGDGAVTGIDAHMEVIRAAVGMIDESVEPIDDRIFPVDDSFSTFNRGSNIRLADSLLRRFGSALGPGFLADCTLDDVRNLRRFKAAVLVEESTANRRIAEMLESKGIKVRHRALPCGYRETMSWAEHIAKMHRMPERLEPFIKDAKERYSECLARSTILCGKEVVIMTDLTERTDWIEDALLDAGVSLRIVSTGPRMHPKHVTEAEHVPNRRDAVALVDSWKPDLVIGNPVVTSGSTSLCEPFPETFISFEASIMFLDRISRVLGQGDTPGWKSWREPL